ncbi:MAG: phage holin [Prevotella pectinovora]|uniref:phage holin n=1 Tax=Prevotella pectinovora TaxID=1602169 RepID=UPI002E77B975|nr:phage holin [Prevotella pectinovora]MEE1547442.1 phage holin [Prevotella pectinovora]
MNNIKVATITRTAVLILALANQILSATGHSPIPVDDAQLEQLISTGITVGAAIWAWWENNSFTKEAIAADNYLDSLIGRKEK